VTVPDPEKQRLAAEQEALATRFDGWRRQVDALLRGVSTNQGGEEVWTGPAAVRFTDALRPLDRELVALPAAFERTARNLRASARRLRAED
jgi:uncharacterized protein YukE